MPAVYLKSRLRRRLLARCAALCDTLRYARVFETSKDSSSRK